MTDAINKISYSVIVKKNNLPATVSIFRKREVAYQ
jgi:hypothetical protein